MQQSEYVTGSLLGVAARTAIILATNKLRGGADLAQALASRKGLVAALGAQTLAPQPVAQRIITHDGFSEQACADIAGLAGFPIDFVLIGSVHSYYEAKNLGFDHSDPLRCNYVAFCDADCTPAAQWGRAYQLQRQRHGDRADIDRLHVLPDALRPGATVNFYANHAAFRHAVFDQYRYQELQSGPSPLNHHNLH